MGKMSCQGRVDVGDVGDFLTNEFCPIDIHRPFCASLWAHRFQNQHPLWFFFVFAQCPFHTDIRWQKWIKQPANTKIMSSAKAQGSGRRSKRSATVYSSHAPLLLNCSKIFEKNSQHLGRTEKRSAVAGAQLAPRQSRSPVLGRFFQSASRNWN